jgi:hypothetical protein
MAVKEGRRGVPCIYSTERRAVIGGGAGAADR